MTVHHARIALTAVLIGITLFVPGTHLQAQETLDELRTQAEQGVAEAQFGFGFVYLEGLVGVLQNDGEAGRWFRLAADQGYAPAQYNLGSMYANGQGVPQDYVEAHMWFNLAAAWSSGEDRVVYVRNRDLAAERMTPEQIAEAQRRAREWTPMPDR